MDPLDRPSRVIHSYLYKLGSFLVCLEPPYLLEWYVNTPTSIPSLLRPWSCAGSPVLLLFIGKCLTCVTSLLDLTHFMSRSYVHYLIGVFKCWHFFYVQDWSKQVISDYSISDCSWIKSPKIRLEQLFICSAANRIFIVKKVHRDVLTGLRLSIGIPNRQYCSTIV